MTIRACRPFLLGLVICSFCNHAAAEKAASQASSALAVIHNKDKADSVVLPMLRAVVLQPYGTVAQQLVGQSISAEGLDLAHSSGVFKLIRPYIGHVLTFRKMHELTGAISVYFRKHGRAFISINVPPQTVHDGVLHINVMEYRLGHITVHGNRWIPSWIVRRDSGLETGQTLTLDGLKTTMDWMNLNPFRTIDMIYRPGVEPGATDVDLHVADRFPVYAYAAYNNQADPSVGRLNWYVGASWGNAFNLGQILTYQFNRTNSGLFNNHAASWTIPVSSRNAIQIFGNYAMSRPVTPIPWLSHGSGGQVSIRWLHMINHIRLGRTLGIDGMLQIGYDWKTTDSYQYDTTNTQHPQASHADTNQFVFAYNGSLQDPWGQTQINNQIVYSPGGLTRYDTGHNYESIIPYAKPDYVYDRLLLTRNIALPRAFSSTTKVSFQRASVNLIYGEQLMAGGMGNARGYYANTSFGSNANSFSQEIYAPPFSLAKITHMPELEDTNKIGFFWDWIDNRQVRHAGVNGIGPRAATLSSVGVDLNSSFNQRMNVTFDAGYRLRRIHTNLLAPRRGMFCDFQVIAGF